ncbi:uncharacterized protein A1O9_06492 [Exophiala aquamarina CBS 119918]|uniref:Nudix hydrolase domain-containing protein n=1 Tax=Exophiala aquamarina CBS 119918 TaxID=1182545 RepID=A0A072PFA8_9EURO|nr:uncharacterized protein A1O9_06492 [Exophiala aquamarina CBS 119918]KEF58566.1 hypothetical protein A1O9_06492 [Exophiala aquamarina CBS 119918]
MTQPKTPHQPPCPAFDYTKYLVDEYDIPYESHVAKQPEAEFRYKYVASGAFVIESHPTTPKAPKSGCSPDNSGPGMMPKSPTSENKLLLIQRSVHDSMPGKWEIPGGGCDPEDPSMLYSVARELWEEAGLKATRIGPLVGGTDHIFLTRTGNLVCKFSFLVDVEKTRGDDGGENSVSVKLDPNEHQAFVWATEQEVRAGWVGDVELQFTNRQTLEGALEAFRTKREMEERGSTVV